MFHSKNLAEQYLLKHYNIVDRGVMPFRYGITTIDFIVYDKAKDTLVAVRLYSMDDSYADVMAEWAHKDRPYFVRAIKRYAEKRSWRMPVRADLVWVKGNGEINHVVGDVKTMKRRR